MADKFVDALETSLAGALVGALIPSMQLAWQLVSDGKRKTKLRASIAELATQRDAFARLDQDSERAKLIADLDAELKQKIAELLALNSRPASVLDLPQPTIDNSISQLGKSSQPLPSPSPQEPHEWPSPFARASLLYAPSGTVGWLLHALFYVYVLVLVCCLVDLLADPSDPDLAFNLLGVYLACFPAEFLRRMTLRYDRRKRFGPAPPRHLPRRRWIPISLFWYATVAIPIGALTPFMDEPGGLTMENFKSDYPGSLAFVAYFALLAVCSRGWAKAIEANASRAPRPSGAIRSALLLYRPTETRGWIATIAYYASLGILVGFAAFTAWVWRVLEPDDIAGFAAGFFFALLPIIAARGWAARYRPRAGSPATAQSTPVSAGVS